MHSYSNHSHMHTNSKIMSKRTSHLKKVTDIAAPMTPLEQRDLEQNVAIGKLWEEMKPTIDDPMKLAITVAKIYARAVLLTYQQSIGKVSIKTEDIIAAQKGRN
jgi:hypothetical protein